MKENTPYIMLGVGAVLAYAYRNEKISKEETAAGAISMKGLGTLLIVGAGIFIITGHVTRK